MNMLRINLACSSSRGLLLSDLSHFTSYKLLYSSMVKCSRPSHSIFKKTFERRIATSAKSHQVQQEKAVSKHVKKEEDFGTKVKEATKTTYYSAVFFAGVGVIAFAGYYLFKELLAPFSTQGVYSNASKLCLEDPRIIGKLGEPIKVYGEESRRGRRQHVRNKTYEMEGQKGIRMQFHLKGSRRSGTAHLDARDAPTGWFYRYLYLQMDDSHHETVVVQDNRAINQLFDGKSDANYTVTPPATDLTPIFPSSK